ncbi:DUF1566 domain-containing protein [Microbulbifer sp. SAOS-129_SWC]|uniref:Lcl C-terminal domain-containing protein n=1 Tax=Microbulbifer sp. SAOS-129_SWC TaxID=3145235 RepID=UPI003216272F
MEVQTPNTETNTEAASTELEWSETLLDGEDVTYEAAEQAIAELGEGWRMPTRKELESLIDTSRYNPAIDTEKFPDTKSDWYWTSTPCAWNDAAVWVVDFSYGYVTDDRRYDSACVRAVRAGQ